MTEREVLSQMSTGILRWFPFKKNAEIMLVPVDGFRDTMAESYENIKNWLEEEEFRVSRELNGAYDYIILLGVPECWEEPAEELKKLLCHLETDGRLLMAVNNRFAIRNFCGDRDVISNRVFDGVDNYASLFVTDQEIMGARSYAKFEWKKILEEAGYCHQTWYSVFPDIRYAQLIYEENYLPNEELVIRYQPYYNHPDSVFLKEETLLNQLAHNGMLHSMANGYLIECSKSSVCQTGVVHATLALDRGKESTYTLIRKKEETNDVAELIVEKNVCDDTGLDKYKKLLENNEKLNECGIKTVPAKIEGTHLEMPYICATGGMEYFRELAGKGKKEFLVGLDRLYRTILSSSEHVELPPDWVFGVDDVSGKSICCKNPGVVLKHGFLDMMPLNMFVVGDEFVFFDQEFCEDNYPANAIFYRALLHIYSEGKIISNCLSFREALGRYKLEDEEAQWQRLDRVFSDKLRHRDVLRDFERKHQMATMVSENRDRINYSSAEYRELFTQCLKDTEGKEVIVFGTGTIAKRFLDLMKTKLSIKYLIDNDERKQNECLHGIQIKTPDVLLGMNPDEYKLIICVRQYAGILFQIEKMGVKNYGIFNPDIEYVSYGYNENICSVNSKKEIDLKTEKRYKIGYIAGVFDLFHIGHLNLLRKAKEQCEYLIVGVVPDASVQASKGNMPVVPFEERCKIVEACKYVDRVVEIPGFAGDSIDAWHMYHFDVQFSGSDYEKDMEWMNKKKQLEKYGSTIVFFPYTESTSSTKRREEIKHI